MEERRFDDLTRALGRGASRRQVLKGLLGAALGGALAAVGVRAPRTALATTTCNGVPFDPSTQCCETSGVQPVYPIVDLDFCPNRVPHPGHVPAFNGCGPAQGFISHIIPNRIGPTRNIDFTPACNNHDICYDTCNSVKSECDHNFLADMSAACAAAYPGRGFIDRYMRTACTADAYIYYTAVSQTATGTEAYESAQKQACDCCAICAECGGPGDDRCCNGFCRPSCPVGYHRDPDTCTCVKDGDGGGKGGDCPACQSGTAGNCVPDSSQDGNACGSCGQCSNGTCIPDPNKSCPTCKQCGAGGVCEPEPDNTTCGSNEVCCGGTCQAGASCGPCSDFPNGHQCPADVNGNQTCCYGDSPCCADDLGNGICGPTDGVCCPVGTTLQCGPVCCDLATEQCSFHGGPETGTCCPKGQVAIDDGTCCPEGQTCGVYGSRVCCPSGQQCATDPEQTVFICCSSAYAGSDSVCCPESFVYAHCADGADICCGISQNDEECCTGHGGPA